MTTIGTATLQIIPSLLGVTEAIERQLDGKAIEVSVAPKVDQRATEAAGKQTRETVEKQTTQVKVEPKVDTRAAEKAGKDTGDAVTKGAKDAVRKGDIGKTVSDEVTKTVEKASPGKDIAKVLVDGIADGVKRELRGGPLVDEFVDGLADGMKQGIGQGGVGKTIVDTIAGGIKSGDVGKTIKDAVLPGITQIGKEIRGGAADWARGIGDALRAGDIEGATTDIGDTVRTTTDLIANIGATFGLQLDGVRKFGDGSATTLQTVGGNVQDILGKASSMKSTFADTGNLLGVVLPERAGSGAKSIINSLGTIIPIATSVYDVLNMITQNWHAGQQERFWNRWEADNRARDAGVKPPQPGVGDFGGPPRVGQGNAPAAPSSSAMADDLRAKIRAGESGQLPAGFSLAPNGDILGPDGKVFLPGRSAGGFTGNWPVNKIAGVVHGAEYVVNASSTKSIENAYPGLLDFLNNQGRLPGYAGGGLVAGAQELRKIISERFGISNIGGYRPGGDGYNEHSTGRALDVMVGNNKSKGDAVKDFALANASAIDLKWVIWRQHLFYPGGGGYDMEDRGNPTQNHMDHVHIFSGTGITNRLRGALQSAGSPITPQAAAPGAIDPASIDATPATTAAPMGTQTQPGNSIGIKLPSSFSGLSTIGLDGLGLTTKVTPDSPERTFEFGNAAGSAIGGQLSSALGMFGVPDSPGWLQGISKFIGGLSISDANGKPIFGGGSTGSALSGMGSLFGGGQDDGYGGAAPVAVSAPVAGVPQMNVHGSQAGQQPGPAGPTYNIRTAVVEDAFIRAQRIERERAAAKLSRY